MADQSVLDLWRERREFFQKLEAIEKYLEYNPDRRDDVVFILIAVPSREDVGEYATLKENIELAVSRINGKFATISNIPVHFINRRWVIHDLGYQHIG